MYYAFAAFVLCLFAAAAAAMALKVPLEYHRTVHHVASRYGVAGDTAVLYKEGERILLPCGDRCGVYSFAADGSWHPACAAGVITRLPRPGVPPVTWYRRGDVWQEWTHLVPPERTGATQDGPDLDVSAVRDGLYTLVLADGTVAPLVMHAGTPYGPMPREGARIQCGMNARALREYHTS